MNDQYLNVPDVIRNRENLIADLRQQLTALQAEKERLEGEVGRLREGKLIALTCGMQEIANWPEDKENVSLFAKNLLASIERAFSEEKHPTTEQSDGN